MTHEAVKVTDISNFAWFDAKSDAMSKAAALQRKGISPKIGGKRAKSWKTYDDIKAAAIYQNRWSGSGMPWVVAW